ncbi:MAG: tRNA lysidine(34) synthetase TilS [Erysipelotrichaceae bacterium]|nr:tRNA lysidine(34) synthetase TilS [Erysipelotrichaceae bacterium]
MNESLLDKDKYYVIGVSGGCDSMYLLDTLYKKGYRLFVAHVNYNYRYDSYKDFELVSEYCSDYGIPFYYKEFHHKDYEDGNFQDRARELRYNFYKEIYDLYHCDGLILGHHLDDHLESVYMQLQRHNTVHYLGIKEKSHVKDMLVLRPLMHMYKEDILASCHSIKIPYHDDYTNFETDFDRDKVRNLVLKNYTRVQKEELLNKADKHNQRIKELEIQVKPYYDLYNADGIIYYYYIPKELRDIFLYLILRDVMHPTLISYSLIQEIKHQIHSVKPNIQMNLPVNYLFIKEYDNIYIIDKDKIKGYHYEFSEFVPFGCEYFHLLENGHVNEGVYLSKEDYPITIRTMQEGDSIMTSSGTKKLSRLFINAKIPAMKRKTWPVVLNKDQTIILVPHIAKNIDYLTTKPNVFVIK